MKLNKNERKKSFEIKLYLCHEYHGISTKNPKIVTKTFLFENSNVTEQTGANDVPTIKRVMICERPQTYNVLYVTKFTGHMKYMQLRNTRYKDMHRCLPNMLMS